MFVKLNTKGRYENENGENGHAEIKVSELEDDISDFIKIVEVAYSKNTVDERFKSSGGIGRFNLLGQRAITAKLLKDELFKIYPDIEIKAFSEKKEGAGEGEERSWVEITLANGDKLVVNIDKNKNNSYESEVRFKSLLEKEGDLYKNSEEIDEDFFKKNNSLLRKYKILKRRYEHVKDNEEYYDELLRGNIYIVGGVASGKTVLMDKVREVLPQKAIDIGKLFRVATHIIISDQEENSLQPNIDKIKNGDMKEEERIKMALNYKTRLLENGLIKSTNIIQKDNGEQAVVFNSVDVTDKLDTLQINTLIPIIAKTPKIRDLVWKWVNQHAEKNKGVVVTGHSLKDINITKYKVINLLVNDDVAAVRMFDRNPGSFGSLETAMDLVKKRNLKDKVHQTNEILSNFYSYSTIDSTFLPIDHIKFKALKKISQQSRDKVEQAKDQKENGLERKAFEWQTNPLIAMVRIYGNQIFLDQAKKYKDFGINEFDISIQSMIHLAGYEMREIWNGDKVVLNDIVSLVKIGEVDEARNILETKIQSGQIRLNSQLVEAEAERQCKKIIDIFDKIRLNVESGIPGSDISKLQDYMGKPESSPFRSITDPAIDSKKPEKKIDPETGMTVFIVKEKNSKKKIVIKRVPSEVSKLYGKIFHYLHEGRNDEIAAFGAYIDGDKYPFAWVSYSPVERKYKRDMLEYFNIEPHRILEMTRAWNCPWSPKNTMSVMFQFAHDELKKEWNGKSKNGEVDKPLVGVVTAINGNLGFQAKAFNGVGFKTIGLKPAKFTYLIDDDGSLTYMTRRRIVKELGLQSTSELTNNPRYAVNKVPLLPTYEMAVLFSKDDENKFVGKPIFKILSKNYRKG